MPEFWNFALRFCTLSLLLNTACQPTATQPANPQASGTPQTPNSATPSAMPSKEAQADPEFKAELVQILEQIEPGIQERAEVSALTLEHAKQLAANPEGDFQMQATHGSYQPLPPTYLETQLLAHQIYSTDNLVSAYLSDGDRDQARQRFVAQIQDIVGPTPFTHYGLAVIRKGQAWYISVVLYTEVVTLQGVATELKKPGTQTFSGQITQEGYSKPEFLLTRPDGSVQTLETPQQDPTHFQAQLPFDQAGLYSVELSVQGPLGPLPACNFIVAVQEDYPAPSHSEGELEKLTDLNAARQKMLTLLNQDRQAQGQNPLILDERLSQAAQAHCDDMIQNGFVGHNSPTIGTPQMQAERFQISDLVAQNISISRSLDNAEAELMSSPGHRMTILDPMHTHVGLGISTGKDGFLYLTQTFVHRELDLDPLPFETPVGSTLQVTGSSTQTGAVIVYLGQEKQGDYKEVQAGERFSLPVTLNNSGRQRLRVGFSPPATTQGSDTVFNFTFYNVWDLNVTP